MTRKRHVRFGGGPWEQGWQQHLAGGLPYFQAAIVALLREGIRPTGQWGHEFVHAQFVRLLINQRKRYDAELRRVLAENQSVRDQADYRAELVTATQASRALRRSRAFVNAVSHYRNQLPQFPA